MFKFVAWGTLIS